MTPDLCELNRISSPISSYFFCIQQSLLLCASERCQSETRNEKRQYESCTIKQGSVNPWIKCKNIVRHTNSFWLGHMHRYKIVDWLTDTQRKDLIRLMFGHHRISHPSMIVTVYSITYTTVHISLFLIFLILLYTNITQNCLLFSLFCRFSSWWWRKVIHRLMCWDCSWNIKVGSLFLSWMTGSVIFNG